VALDARQSAPFRPPAIAIHNDRDVAGTFLLLADIVAVRNLWNLSARGKILPLLKFEI